MLRRAKTLTQQAADEIRARIVWGDFQLGAPLSENALAAELGVSKTPVREALLQLKMEGLVRIHPQRGSFVFDMTPTEIVELGELREVLELAALDLSVRRRPAELLAALRELLGRQSAAIEVGDYERYRRLDAEFHDTLFRFCGNQMMHDCYRALAFRIDAMRIRLARDNDLNRTSRDEHEGIVAHIADGDIDAARESLSAHMQGTIWGFAAARRRGDAA